MKYFLASSLAASLIGAQHIDQLIGDLMNQVYHVDDDGYQIINLAPYYTAKIMMGDNNFTSDCTMSNGRTGNVVKFSESGDWSNHHLNYVYQSSGRLGDLPWADLYDQAYVDTQFTNDNRLKADDGMIQMTGSGEINGVPVSADHKIELTGVQSTIKKLSADFKYTRQCSVPAEVDDYWKDYLCPDGSSDLDMAVSVKNACLENPFDKSCNAKITVTGTNDGQDLGKSVVRYSTGTNHVQLKVSHADNEVFYVAISGIKDWDLIQIKYRLGAGTDLVLFFQVVGPAEFESVSVAAMTFAMPFMRFFQGLTGFDDAAHLVAYFDKVLLNVAENTYFDFSPVFAATQIESELFADLLDVASLQHAVSLIGEQFNYMVAGFSSDAAPGVTLARDYVRNVVSDDGEAVFDSWFASL